MGVRMRHPELDAEIVVAASAVPIHRGSGWEPVEGQDDMGEELPAELQRFEGQPPVRMRHPDVQDEITVAESAVPVHRSTGWLVIDEQAEAATQADLEAKTVPELRELAKARDIKPIPATKPELLAALGGAPVEQEQAGEAPAEPSEESEE